MIAAPLVSSKRTKQETAHESVGEEIQGCAQALSFDRRGYRSSQLDRAEITARTAWEGRAGVPEATTNSGAVWIAPSTAAVYVSPVASRRDL